MTDYALDPRLAADTLGVGNLDLCELRLMNDSRYQWAVLAPRRSGVSELYELTRADRALLMEEIAAVAEALARLAGADKMNVAALGNEVRQLHVHVIARKKSDPAGARPVWGVGKAAPYQPGEGEALAAQLASALRLRANANSL